MPGKLLKRELAQALQHPEPLLSRDRSCWFDQAGVRQGSELTEQRRIVAPVAYHCRCRNGPASAEDRQRPERLARCLIKQLVTPVDRSPQRLLPRRAIPAGLGEKV
jgi:hypothetical protein